MTNVQVINHNGQLAAIVIGEDHIIPEPHLTAPGANADEVRTVQAKALYATEIHAGRMAGPYTDEDAEIYAAIAIA